MLSAFTSRKTALFLSFALVWGVAAQDGNPAPKQPSPRPYKSFGAKHKVEVNALEALRLGGRTIAVYGDRHLVEIDSAQLESLSPDGAPASLRDQYNVISFRSGAIDTTITPRTPSTESGGERLHIVQFAGPLQPEWYEELVATGVNVIQYIPENAYLVYGDSDAINRIGEMAQQKAHVQWESAYNPEYKFTEVSLAERVKRVTEEQMRGMRNRNAAAPAATAVPTSNFVVQLVAPGSPSTIALIDQFKSGAYINDYSILKYRNIEVSLPGDAAIKILASQPDVVTIEPAYAPTRTFDERQNMLIAGKLTGNAPTTGIDWLAYLASKGFNPSTPSSFVVDLADSGIDNGTTNPNHFALFAGGTYANGSRVMYNRLEGTPNTNSTLVGLDGHGTLNAHIIGGYVPSGTANGVNYSLTPHTDSSGFRYGLGVAPFVRLGSSVIFDPYFATNPNYPNMASRAYRDGARISNNSWANGGNGIYNALSQAYDALVRDAQPTGSAISNPGNQQMIYVFAAGNQGSSASSVNAPATAKNVITVGASEGVNLFGGSDSCLTPVPDTAADSANDMATFSGRGPTADGRIKPDTVAPGTHITGGVAQASQVYTGNGSAISGFTGFGLCGGPNGSLFFPTTQQWYSAGSGTSMAAPAVTGVAALIYQDFINRGLTPPSPALTKALITNSARYMTGLSANDNLYSNNQGMGMVATDTYFDTMAGPKLLLDESELFTSTGQARVFTGNIADSNKPTRISLAWTDAPGSTSGNAYVNNLDLEVVFNGQIYRGNVFSGANSAAGGAADQRNNLESVFLPAGSGGPIAITVRATNIAGDGVPGNATPLDQDFALVVSNFTSVPRPVVTLTGATITSRSCTSAASIMDPGELITMNVTLQNAGFVPTSSVAAFLQTTGGTQTPTASQNYGILAPGASATRSFSFRVDPALPCGATAVQSFTIADGSSSVATYSNSAITGIPTLSFFENFDGVTAPALPSGWTTACTGPGCAQTPAAPFNTAGVQFRTGAFLGYVSSSPNSVGVGNPSNGADATLTSPTFTYLPGTTFSFQHRFFLETNYDGGVLEISANGGPFQDILAAGGTFTANGYNNKIFASADGSPLRGLPAWSGDSGSSLTVTGTLPDSSAGQPVSLRFRMGSDASAARVGWAIDNFQIFGGRTCCTPAAPAPVSPNLSFSITGSGPQSSTSLPVALRLVNGSSGGAQNVVINSIVVSRLAGTGNVTLATTTPISIGAVAGGSTTPVPITLTRDLTVTRVRVVVNATYTDPTIGSSRTITQTLSFFPSN